MESLISVGTGAWPPALHYIPPREYSLTVLGTSSLPITQTGASGKWSPPLGTFRPWPGMEPLISAATAARPPAPAWFSLTAFSWIVQQTYSFPTIVAFGKWLALVELLRLLMGLARKSRAETVAHRQVRTWIY